MQNNSPLIETELLPPSPRLAGMASALDASHRANASRERTARLVSVIGALYRLAVAAGVGVLVWHGASAWLFLAAVPLLWFAPKPAK